MAEQAIIVCIKSESESSKKMLRNEIKINHKNSAVLMFFAGLSSLHNIITEKKGE